MSGLEIGEALEALETMESPSVSELQEQREQLHLQADAAREAGNIEKANYFFGEIAKLTEQLAQMETGEEDGEAILGKGFASGRSETYWKDEMAKEYATYGKTPYYYTCKKNYEAAVLNA